MKGMDWNYGQIRWRAVKVGEVVNVTVMVV